MIPPDPSDLKELMRRKFMGWLIFGMEKVRRTATAALERWIAIELTMEIWHTSLA